MKIRNMQEVEEFFTKNIGSISANTKAEVEKVVAGDEDYKKYILPGGRGLDVEAIWRDYRAKTKTAAKQASGG